MNTTQLNIGQMHKSRSLTNDLANSLRAQIIDGNMQSGSKLPSSKSIEEAAGVSRSVVREAIAVLKAEGLLESRQGVGVFITERTKNKLFAIDEKEFSSIEDAIKILELRMAVEIAMAGMAAANRTEKQMREINACLQAVEKKLKAGKDGQQEDFNFHLSIAKASGNHYFVRFVEFLGSGVIPAREIIVKHDKTQKREDFYEIICSEHRAIARAIENKNIAAAKKTINAHLTKSRQRHLKISKALAKPR